MKILLVLLSLISTLFSDTLPDIQELRKLYYESVEHEKKARKLYNELNQRRSELEPLYLGYLGSAESLLAKHSWNPYNKLDYLNKGMETLRKAISSDPDNLELRFLRFSVQHYLPSFLGQSKNLSEDRDMMVKLIKEGKFDPADLQIVKNAIVFLLQTKRCTSDQQKFLNSYISR